jgi:hypothetical protein
MLTMDGSRTTPPDKLSKRRRNKDLLISFRSAYGRFALLLTLLIIAAEAIGQCTITSSSNYTVIASVVPIELVPSTMTCPWGYNYNVKVAYDVAFVGPGAPASMYTLQGNVICGSQSLFFNLPNSGGSGTVTTTSNPWRGLTDCATAGLGTLSCYTVRLQINGPGIPNQTQECAYSPLPVELIAFDATLATHGVELSWQTASERNSLHFLIERSSDGELFSAIQQVEAQGYSTTETNYTAVDPDPIEGLTYYRIRQVDADGGIFFGPWAVVESKVRKRSITVYPNPNEGRSLWVQDAEPGSLLQLFDAAGNPALEKHLSETEIQLPDLAAGLYLGSVTAPNGVRTSFRYVQL